MHLPLRFATMGGEREINFFNRFSCALFISLSGCPVLMKQESSSFLSGIGKCRQEFEALVTAVRLKKPLGVF